MNGVRKVLSLITLKRIEENVIALICLTQHGYMKDIKCEDIVWAQKMLESIIPKKKWSFSKMGIDISRAFDRIKRKTILSFLNEAC